MATIVGGVVIWYSVYPVPAAPIGSAVFVALGWLVVGFVVAYYYARRHPEMMRQAGRSRD
ncbi:MAG: hypothetical protein ACYCPF_06180 [Streptosporangiaceae bacterium]